ncbi:MAG: Rpp14/Pop5 family protein [Candidatus Hydrothermarchaeales archaeon]
MKVKKLPPSLRERKRYIAFRVEGDEPLSREQIVRAVRREVMSFLGENRMSELNIWVLDFNADAQQGFIVCHHKAVGEAKACLAMVSIVDGIRLHLAPIGISGTIKTLKRKFLKDVAPVAKESRDIEFMGGVKLVKSRGQCLDALPHDNGLKRRVNDLNMKYIGLMREDIEQKGK